MKAILLIILIVFILSPMVHAERFTLKILQISQLGLSWADTVTTNIGMGLGAHESNPIYSLIIDSPPMTAFLDASINLAIILGTNWLYKKSKPLGIVAIVAINIARGCVVIHNMRVIRNLR